MISFCFMKNILDHGKEYELDLKIKAEFLGFDDGYLVFDSGIRGETYIALNEIQNVYEAKE